MRKIIKGLQHTVLRMVQRVASRRPYTHLALTAPFIRPPHEVPADYDLYMARWWVFNENWGLSRKYPWLAWLPAIRLHHVSSSDRDRHMHDHPWDNLSIILFGRYVEVMPQCPNQSAEDDRVPARQIKKLRRPWRPVFRRAADRHRLVLFPGESVWSLFIMFRWQREWGFLTEDGWVPHYRYPGQHQPTEGRDFPETIANPQNADQTNNI